MEPTSEEASVPEHRRASAAPARPAYERCYQNSSTRAALHKNSPQNKEGSSSRAAALLV